MKSASLFTVLTASLAFVCACNPPPVDPPATPEAKPTGRVDLPPLVKLAGSLPPEKHDDGTFRIDGLLARRSMYLGEAVKLKGYVLEVYQCPKKAKKCEPPHVWVGTSPAGGEKKLPIVNFPDEKLLKKLKVGQPYIIEGVFRRRSDRGFTRSAGLIVQSSITPAP